MGFNSGFKGLNSRVYGQILLLFSLNLVELI
jgi:hypothetical protein